jgi:hypothetical protein
VITVLKFAKKFHKILMASLLHVTSEKSQDAAGQTGIYTGQVRVDSGKPEGKGIMEYSQGPLHQYDGDWSSGLWEGQGTCTLKNGDEYKGEFVQHERHGNGAYTVSSTPSPSVWSIFRSA